MPVTAKELLEARDRRDAAQVESSKAYREVSIIKQSLKDAEATADMMRYRLEEYERELRDLERRIRKEPDETG